MKIADHLITTDSGKTRHGLYAGGGNVITLQGLTSRSVIVISLKEFAKHQTCFIRSYPCIFRDDLASDFGMSRPPISVSSGH